MPTEPAYSIADLASLAGVTPRTVRYYIAQGLLPGPEQVGRGATYGEAHLARLRLIRRLAREHLPLAEIRSRLEALSDAEVLELEPPAPPEPPPFDSALEYLRAVLEGGSQTTHQLRIAEPTPLRRLESPIPPAVLASPALAADEMDVGLADESKPASPGPDTEPEPALTRSQWDRVSLAPDIELHLRRPLSRHQNRRVERLIAIARELLKEDQP
jgi:DNA-binding transcriptional MerR regulator